jgi:hypothetical protein
MAAKPKKKKDATRYNQDAIELARKLYCKYGGQNLEAVEREMRKAGYPGWRKGYLFDKGREGTTYYREGWITKHGFENSLRLYTVKLVESVNDDEQDLYIGIKNTRKILADRIAGGKGTKDDLYAYRDFCKLEIEARRNLDLSRDNLETFAASYEKILTWSTDIDKKLASLLVKHNERFMELAAAHYGQKETVDDRTEPGEDEGGSGTDADPGRG